MIDFYVFMYILISFYVFIPEFCLGETLLRRKQIPETVKQKNDVFYYWKKLKS